MRTLLLLVSLFFINNLLHAQSTKVLFLGNSYTYANDLPQMIEDLSLSMGDVLNTDQNTPGGHSMMAHAANATSHQKIQSQDWDFVVLQAQSQEPSWSVEQIEVDVFPYAKLLSDTIKYNHACSEILFFSTWGRKDGDAYNCEEWPPVCTFEGMNDRLTVGYYTMAEQNEASVSPVGMAWKVAREDGVMDDINLYSGDGSHPSVYGTYLTACVFYQSIFGKNIENANYYASLSQAEAEYLQSVANSIFAEDFSYVLDDEVTATEYNFTNESWVEHGHQVLTRFNFEQNAQNEYSFTFSNQSLNADSYLWNFGDGTQSTEAQPTHLYEDAGVYEVSLLASNDCFSTQITHSVVITSDEVEGTKVLFLGNSYTYYNDLPQLIKNLSLSMGDLVYTDQNTPGGQRLMDHAENAISYGKIKDQDWDFVVLQAQSQEPSWPIAQIETEVFPFAQQLCDSVKLNHTCSEVLYFSTWGRKNGDADNCESWPPVCTFEGMNDRLTVAYYTMAEQTEASVSPVGMAWKIAREDGLMDEINLYNNDGSHPSVYGSYLAACVFYQSIFKKPVEDANFYAGIAQAKAEYLQAVANSVFAEDFSYVLDDDLTANEYHFTKDSWYEYGQQVLAEFDYEQTGFDFEFTNSSLNAEYYSWFFGDGGVSVEAQPSYSYNSAGAFDVQLAAQNDCFADTIIQHVDIVMGIEAQESMADIKLWSKAGRLYFENIATVQSIEIFDILGQRIQEIMPNGDHILDCQVGENYKSLIVKMNFKTGKAINRKIVL